MFHGKGNDEHAIYMQSLTMTVVGSGKKNKVRSSFDHLAPGEGGAGTEKRAREESQTAKAVRTKDRRLRVAAKSPWG